MREYKEIIQQMYNKISDFVDFNPDIRDEMLVREEDFFRLSFFECNAAQMFFDWFVFDYRLIKYNKRLFDVFLLQEQKTASKSLLEIYSKIGKDRFSFFKVKSLKIGKYFLLEDVITSKEYQVFDSQATKSILKGDYIIGRLLPFDTAFIIASYGICYQKQDYDIFGMAVKQLMFERQGRIDAYDVYKIIYEQKIPEKLSVEEKFELLCKEGGLSDYAIEDIFLKIRMAIKDRNKLPKHIIGDVIEKMKIPEWFNVEEFSESFIAVWNFFAEQIYQGAKKGPIEMTLINICMDTAASKFSDPTDMSEEEIKDHSAKIQKWSDEWFVTSQKELDGKTPKEIIMQERKSLGNSQEDFGFDFNIELMPSDLYKEQQAEKLFYAAAEHMNNDEYKKALELYQEYLKLWDKNHVVWHNMGVCYVMLLQKRKAEKCLHKAWLIKSDYDIAYQKWEELQSMYKEDMVEMVRQIKKNKRLGKK